MTFKDVALSMWQYWAMGAAMIGACIWAGKGELVRVEKKAVIKFSLFLVMIAFWRLLTLKYILQIPSIKAAAEGIKIIPIGATLTVFWEDACHGLPLLLLRLWTGMETWWKKAFNYAMMLAVMVSFGSGHIYQGYFAAMLLMAYIPYSIKLGKEYGFGTVMVGHTLYDLSTILVMRHVMGVLF